VSPRRPRRQALKRAAASSGLPNSYANYLVEDQLRSYALGHQIDSAGNGVDGLAAALTPAVAEEKEPEPAPMTAWRCPREREAPESASRRGLLAASGLHALHAVWTNRCRMSSASRNIDALPRTK
jgi:hypothetical protein